MKQAQFFTMKEFTGRHMLAAMLSFFGVIITVNMTMAWFAAGSWSGLVAKNGYVESINYKGKQAAFEKQRGLGWKSQIRLQNDQVIFAVKNAEGKAVTGLAIVAKLGRPATEKSDTEMFFTEANPGEYLASAPRQTGQWLIEIKATGKNDELYKKNYRVLVKDRK